jgi:tetratricopeptide (TPR) repeat protein
MDQKLFGWQQLPSLYQNWVLSNPLADRSSHVAAHYELGWSHQQNKEYDLAIEHYIEIKDQHFGALANLAWLYHAKREYQKAMGFYREIADLKAIHSRDYHYLDGIFQLLRDDSLFHLPAALALYAHLPLDLKAKATTQRDEVLTYAFPPKTDSKRAFETQPAKWTPSVFSLSSSLGVQVLALSE